MESWHYNSIKVKKDWRPKTYHKIHLKMYTEIEKVCAVKSHKIDNLMVLTNFNTS